MQILADSETALELAQASSFDVIVLDVTLPKLDGLAVSRRFRDAHNQTPVLILTARDTDIGIVRTLDNGFVRPEARPKSPGWSKWNQRT